VVFAGWQNNPFRLLAAADLFVLSSRYEGFPNALMEAMAVGLPVLSTACPSGPAELLENGRHGVLVPVGDPAAMADAILHFCANPALRSEYAALSRARIEEYSLDAMLAAYADLLDKLALSPQSRCHATPSISSIRS
jgi:glycosyltransferase involved in cell wall biosynthesis